MDGHWGLAVGGLNEAAWDLARQHACQEFIGYTLHAYILQDTYKENLFKLVHFTLKDCSMQLNKGSDFSSLGETFLCLSIVSLQFSFLHYSVVTNRAKPVSVVAFRKPCKTVSSAMLSL